MTDHALTVMEPHRNAPTLVRPIAKPSDLLQLHDDITAIIRENLREGLDYGIVPGTKDEPALYQPGAEKINMAFGASGEFEVVEQEVDHDRTVKWQKKKKKYLNRHPGDKDFRWEVEDGTSLGLYRYVVRCRIMRDGRVLGTCIGACSTLESKYIDRPRDVENTVFKMAQKRAYVGATKAAYALSKRFFKLPPAAPVIAPARIEGPSPVEAPPPSEPPPAEHAPAPAKRAGFDGGPEQQQIVATTLKKRKVPEELWEEIGRRLLGRSFNDLAAVIDEVWKR